VVAREAMVVPCGERWSVRHRLFLLCALHLLLPDIKLLLHSSVARRPYLVNDLDGANEYDLHSDGVVLGSVLHKPPRPPLMH
jgi:hypothetical protein